MPSLASFPILLLSLCVLCGPHSDSLALFSQWSRSPSPQLRIQAAKTLRGIGGAKARAALLSLLDDDHCAVRAAARAEIVLRDLSESRLLENEIAKLKRPRARVEGLRALIARGYDPTPFALDPAPEVRRRALATGRVAREALLATLDRGDPISRGLALECLDDPSLARGAARDRREEVRIAAARIAVEPETACRLLKDRSWRVRLAAIRACERLRDPRTIGPLIDHLGKARGRLRASGADALERLTGAPHGSDASRWKRWWEGVRDGYELPAIRARRPKRQEHTSARITFRRIPVVSRRLCFVIDASRSMSKPAPGAKGSSRWELVVRDLLGVLERLPGSARFNIILFRTEVESWRPRLVAASAGSRRACRDWIEGIRPSGWTNLFDALELALSDDDVDTLYLLTDGVPSRGVETERAGILREIEYRNRYRLVQINCVQAGSSKGLGKGWHGFLEELAAAHDGVSVRE